MTRSEMREQIFRLLFCIEFYPEEEWSEQLIYLADDEDGAKADTASQKDIDYIQTKAAAAAVLADSASVAGALTDSELAVEETVDSGAGASAF